MKNGMATMTQDRYRGAMVGLALGDSLGAPYEFQNGPILKRPVTFGTGVFGTGPGEPTDDSTLAVYAAEAMLEDADDFANAYVTRLVRWAESGPPDIGAATRNAVWWYQRNNSLIPMNEDTQGNGSLMAVTPVILYYANKDPDLTGHAAAAFARITHPSAGAAETNRTFAQFMVAALNDTDLPALNLPCETDKSIGWCRLTLAIATQALVKASSISPLEALLQVIELGGDTDTNAAVAGALIGARYGLDAWPTGLLARLDLAVQMIELADHLYAG